MLDPSNVELEKPSSPRAPRERRAKTPWIALAAVIAVGVIAWLLVASRDTGPPDAAPAGPPPAAEAPSSPGAAEPTDLPAIDAADPLVRRLVAALSSHPLVARWLATDGLIRNFTVVVENIAFGASPARHLPALRPNGSFRTIAGEDDLRIDQRSYQRYTPIASAVDSIDAEGAARLYILLKPRIEEAYAELGRGESFDVTLERAIVAMLRTPALDGEVPLVPTGVVFAFADPALERLTPAQKQLARMGPANVRTIQATLRQIGTALEIPPERLR
jgi:hypothetical protein